MYGMVNKAIEDMVCTNHGEDCWERIKRRAGVDVEVFIGNESYDDVCTYQLVGAAATELKLAPELILEAFGQHWIGYTAKSGYQTLLASGGASLSEFLVNLPNLHTRVAMIYPKLIPPRFECTEVTENSLLLHYYSHRKGLAPFVCGLVKGLGARFGLNVTIQALTEGQAGSDHDIFSICW